MPIAIMAAIVPLDLKKFVIMIFVLGFMIWLFSFDSVAKVVLLCSVCKFRQRCCPLFAIFVKDSGNVTVIWPCSQKLVPLQKINRCRYKNLNYEQKNPRHFHFDENADRYT
jgi:hypothetical protein